MTKNIPLHILLIDNYDSFSYNLVELVRNIGDVRISVLKNDDLAIFRDDFDAVIISPGPGLPEESAFLMEAIDFYIGKIPMLGICLGLQAISIHQGGKLQQLSSVHHGIKDKLFRVVDSRSVLLEGLPTEFYAGRYHSWIADAQHLPENIEITAIDTHGHIMGIEDVSKKMYAVQFHPESYMTEDGSRILENFIALAESNQKAKISEINPFASAFFS